MMRPVKRLQSSKESFIEILVIIKACLTSFWFWLPVLYCVYFWMQIWLIFWVHPLTILVSPIVLSIYAIIQEEKRAKTFYKLNGIKYLSASHPIGEGPKAKLFNWKVEKYVKEYEKLLKKKQEQKDSG